MALTTKQMEYTDCYTAAAKPSKAELWKRQAADLQWMDERDKRQ